MMRRDNFKDIENVFPQGIDNRKEYEKRLAEAEGKNFDSVVKTFPKAYSFGRTKEGQFYPKIATSMSKVGASRKISNLRQVVKGSIHRGSDYWTGMQSKKSNIIPPQQEHGKQFNDPNSTRVHQYLDESILKNSHVPMNRELIEAKILEIGQPEFLPHLGETRLVNGQFVSPYKKYYASRTEKPLTVYGIRDGSTTGVNLFTIA